MLYTLISFIYANRYEFTSQVQTVSRSVVGSRLIEHHGLQLFGSKEIITAFLTQKRSCRLEGVEHGNVAQDVQLNCQSNLLVQS